MPNTSFVSLMKIITELGIGEEGNIFLHTIIKQNRLYFTVLMIVDIVSLVSPSTV